MTHQSSLLSTSAVTLKVLTLKRQYGPAGDYALLCHVGWAFILLLIWLGGKDRVLDITVINLLPLAHIDQSAAVLRRAL